MKPILRINLSHCIQATARVLGVILIGMSLPFGVGKISSQTLSSILLFSTDSAGSEQGFQYWDTRPDPNGFFDLWIVPGLPGDAPDGLTGSFLNGPLGSQVAINLPLVPGTNSFTIFGEAGWVESFHGMNLFFDGHTLPDISVAAATHTGEAIPEIFANSGEKTLDADGNFVPGSGRLSYAAGNREVTLTRFIWSSPEVFTLDRVGAYEAFTSDQDDFVGSLVLVVSGGPGMTPPTIVSQPRSQSILPGQTATLTVAAEGDPAPEYQWYLGERGDIREPIPGATSATFTTGSLGDTATYWVRISNPAGGVDSQTATISVSATLEVKLSTILLFSTDSTGSDSGFQYWDTRPDPNGFFDIWIAPGFPGGEPNGLTESFLNGPSGSQVPVSLLLNQGTNRFTIFGESGPVRNFHGMNLFFDGHTLPDISVAAATRTGEEIPGIFANSGEKTLDADGSFVPGSGRLSYLAGNLEVTLTDFFWAAPELFAQNRVGPYDTSPSSRNDFVGAFTLVVSGGPAPSVPIISSQPQHQVIRPGQSATLTVAATGNPAPGYQWYVGERGDTRQPVPGATSASHAAENLTGTTSFWVRVTNSAGGVDSDTAVVTVEVVEPPKPEISAARYTGVTIRGEVGRRHRVEFAPALADPPAWQELTSFALPSSPYLWFDTNSTGDGQRLYRVIAEP